MGASRIVDAVCVLVVVLCVACVQAHTVPVAHLHNNQQQTHALLPTRSSQLEQALPLEDMPILFGTSSNVAVTPFTRMAANLIQATASKPAVVTRPETVDYSGIAFASRRQAFVASSPHIAGGNCHVSIIRPLSDCQGQCRERGVCGSDTHDDSAGECACHDPWTGASCEMLMSPRLWHAKQEKESYVLSRAPLTGEVDSGSFEYPKVRFCYYTTNASNVLDFTSYDQPSAQITNVIGPEHSSYQAETADLLQLEEMGSPGDAVAFAGTPSLHPADPNAPNAASQLLSSLTRDSRTSLLAAANATDNVLEGVANATASADSSVRSGWEKANQKIDVAKAVVVEKTKAIANKIAAAFSDPTPTVTPTPTPTLAPPVLTNTPTPTPTPSALPTPTPTYMEEEDVAAENLLEPLPQPKMVETFGDLGSYSTATCAVWRYGGPAFSNLQGFVFELAVPVYPDNKIVLEITGSLLCSDLGRTGSLLTGKGKAEVSYILVHSRDGTNVNYRTLDQGTVNITNGQCDGYGRFEGIPVHGHVTDLTPSPGAYVALWLDVQFAHGAADGDFVTVCDDLQYVLKRGTPHTRAISNIDASRDSSSSSRDSSDSTPYDPVMPLPPFEP